MDLFDILYARKQAGGGGSLPSKTYASTITTPATQYGTVQITTGFTPSIVGAWVYDEVNGLDTFTVVYGAGDSPNGEYFQEGGYRRRYTADGTTGEGRGHITGIGTNGFTVQTCEPYFAGKVMRLVALG